MKKRSTSLALGIILLLTVGVFAASTPIIPENVKDFVEKKGIKEEEIQNIAELTYGDLPTEIDIESIDDTNLAIYEVVLPDEKLFVLTFGEAKIKEEVSIIENRQFLNFGFNGETNLSGFLKTATGIETDLNKGYTMMRQGSITGISTNLEIIDSESSATIEIIIYKNDEMIRFGNELNADSEGIKKDYDTQSKNVVTFEPGDVISVYAESNKNIIWKDVIAMIEITTVN